MTKSLSDAVVHGLLECDCGGECGGECELCLEALLLVGSVELIEVSDDEALELLA